MVVAPKPKGEGGRASGSLPQPPQHNFVEGSESCDRTFERVRRSWTFSLDQCAIASAIRSRMAKRFVYGLRSVSDRAPSEPFTDSM